MNDSHSDDVRNFVHNLSLHSLIGLKCVVVVCVVGLLFKVAAVNVKDDVNCFEAAEEPTLCGIDDVIDCCVINDIDDCFVNDCFDSNVCCVNPLCGDT